MVIVIVVVIVIVSNNNSNRNSRVVSHSNSSVVIVIVIVIVVVVIVIVIALRKMRQFIYLKTQSLDYNNKTAPYEVLEAWIAKEKDEHLKHIMYQCTAEGAQYWAKNADGSINWQKVFQWQSHEGLLLLL